MKMLEVRNSNVIIFVLYAIFFFYIKEATDGMLLDLLYSFYFDMRGSNGIICFTSN